jgi:DNA-binding transcriptional ArsR family regulator
MDVQSHLFFHALSDLTRLRVLALLHARGDVCVCDLTRTLAQSQPKISRHLGLLRELGIVQARREGVWMHYHLTPTLPDWAKSVLDVALPAFIETEQGQADQRAWADKQGSCALESGDGAGNSGKGRALNGETPRTDALIDVSS